MIASVPWAFRRATRTRSELRQRFLTRIGTGSLLALLSQPLLPQRRVVLGRDLPAGGAVDHAGDSFQPATHVPPDGPRLVVEQLPQNVEVVIRAELSERQRREAVRQ